MLIETSSSPIWRPVIPNSPPGEGSGGGGGGGDSGQIIIGEFDDPNGNVTPDDPTQPAIYYKEGAVNNQWRWDVPDQDWKQNFG